MKKNNLQKLHIEIKNFQDNSWGDLYHKWLNLSWSKSLALFILTYVVINLVFAIFFWLLGPEAISNSSGNFLECFYFSVQTLGTIGYGHLAPQSNAANLLVAIEAAVGMITVALLSGLFFAKFSQPKARIRFTKKMLISIHHGQKSLQFRMANNRVNPIVDAKMTMTLLKSEVSPEGMRMRKAHDLSLELSHAPMFAATLTGMHNIQNGPLSGVSTVQMCKKGYEFIVTIVGTDGTFGQTIYATKVYSADDIVASGKWGRLGDVLADGTRVVDLNEFDKIIEN